MHWDELLKCLNLIILYHASQYDSFGRISKQITPLGTISYSYSGNQTTINDGTKGYTTIRETDLAGKLKRVTDPGGTITYTYGPSGNPTKIVCGSTTSTMEYDLLGRRTKLIDPNAGTILCSYDGWGKNKRMLGDRRKNISMRIAGDYKPIKEVPNLSRMFMILPIRIK